MSDGFQLLVLGGGPAGFATVRAYRDAPGTGPVALVSDEGRMPYNRPPLTKELLRGESSEDELPLAPDGWLAERDVALVAGQAVELDPSQRTVTLAGGRELRYRTCVLATGAEPQRLPVPGAGDPGVRVVRTLRDLQQLLERLNDGDPVVVVGSGFIGCEIASSLRMRGHPVTLVSDEPAPNQARLSEGPAREIARWLEDDGVQLLLGTEVEGIERGARMLEVTAGGERVHGGLVVMAAGVAPRSELARQAGLGLDDGAIPVSSSMRTAQPALFAAGDVCKAYNETAGRALRVEHWGDALAQGGVAGRSAAGVDAAWSEVPGFWSTIGTRTLKYAAWGDGFDEVHLDRRVDGGFTAWYGCEGALVGVLAHLADADYDRGRELIGEGAPWRC